MIRLAVLFAVILALAAGGAWLADHPGNVLIGFQGFEVQTSFAALVLMAAALMAAASLLVWLGGWLRREVPFLGSSRVIKRQGRGLKLLNQSLVALAAGDHRLALKLAEQAEVLLPPQPMVHLIAAEASVRAGDHDTAAKRYAALEAGTEGRLIGLRGLVAEARRVGRESEALRLARVAFAENRKSPWVLKTLFALEVAAGNWPEAAAALAKVAKEDLMDSDEVARHKGALAYAEAAEAGLRGNRDAARKLYKKALSHRAGFVPAEAALATLELADGNKKRAGKIVMEAWACTPHPSLAKVYKSLDAAESGADWLKRVRTLVDTRPDHPESMLLLVDALMDARDYAAAKPVLDKLTREAPTRAAWQYRLALAHALGENPDPIEAALAHAEDGASWQCADCGHKPKGWSPLCPSCQAFDTIDWRDKGDFVHAKPGFDASNTIALLTSAP